ncbi:DUF550 domain-containing protein [Klebsiella pneumoniae]|nr:DUF550 domain-containing protein [Klebsiella pneumoniae]
MTSKFSIDNKELLQRISSGEAVVGIDFGNLIVRELAAFRLAAMDIEPDCNERNLFCSTDTAGMRKIISVSAGSGETPLYRHAQPAAEREQVRSAHAEWSQATFGNVGPVGPLKHLSKEALEAAAEPGDLSEWADMQFLLWDAQRRAGITDEQITQAMIEKLAVNKQREWPEPKDGEPRLHIKEQPAPVITDGYVMVPKEPTQAMCAAFNDSDYGRKSLRERYVAMLAAAPHDNPALNSLQSVDSVAGKWIPVSEQMPEVGDIVLTAIGCGVTVGETECTATGFRFFTSVISGRELPATHWMPLPAAPQEVK